MAPPRHPTVYERRAPDHSVVDHSLTATRLGVFWLEDAPPLRSPGPLHGSARADLTVVGGGYLGLWTAVLAKRRNPGARVVLLEAQSVGWAASGRNGGFCEASLTHGEANGRRRWPDEYDVLDRLGRENLDAMEQDLRDLGVDCEWERTGMLSIAVEDHQVPWLGSGPEVLTGEAARRELASPIVLAAAWEREGTALVHPGRLARGLALAALELGVEVFEGSPVTEVRTPRAGPAVVVTPTGRVTSDRVALATNVFPSLLRRTRLLTVPVYDYVLMTEPLTAEQRAAIGWARRQGLGDLANQFHYARLTRDDRILYGGYDAIYHRGRQVRASYEDRPESHRRLASHFFTTFPQLEGLHFSHRWAGAIDTCTRFAAFHGLARRGRVAYAAGFTGLGVGATRFAAEVMLDRLEGRDTERLRPAMVRRLPVPFPPEPAAALGVNLARWSLDRADHRQGKRNVFLRALDAAGLGFDS